MADGTFPLLVNCVLQIELKPPFVWMLTKIKVLLPLFKTPLVTFSAVTEA